MVQGLLKHCESLAGRWFQATDSSESYKKFLSHRRTKRIVDCIIRATLLRNAAPEFARRKNLFLSAVVGSPAEHCNPHEQEIKFSPVLDPGRRATGSDLHSLHAHSCCVWSRFLRALHVL